MKKLSVVIPTYNEIGYLADAIKSIEFADEIIVIDSFSTDGTREKALELSCVVLDRKFDNFSSQKNYAISFATGDWILFIDADERVSQKLKIEILDVINNPKHTGYKLQFPHFYMNRFLYHKVDKVVRLVKNEGLSFSGDVHEKLIFKGSVGILNNYMIHYTYKGLSHLLQKKDSYSWFQAQTSFKKGKKAGYFQLIFKPLYRFVSSYFIKRGFMDGVPGLALASVNAYGVFSRYAKIVLIEKGLK